MLQENTTENLRLQGTVWMGFQVTPWLSYKLNTGYEVANADYLNLRKQGGMRYGDDESQPSRLVEEMARFNSYLIENTLNFQKDIGNHDINAVVGFTGQRDEFRNLWAQKDNILTSSTQYYTTMNAALENDIVSGINTRAILLSFFFRTVYSYNEKYLLNFTIRRDGTSRLSKNNRWGNFPSVAGAWRISKEDFFNVGWVSDLKLRANYGTLGSSNIGPWDYQPIISTALHTVMGLEQKEINGAAQVQLVNEELRWETLTEQNYGFDIGFFGNKILLTGEYYVANATDILAGIPIAATTGNSGGNPLVKYKDFSSQLKHNIGFNITTLNNEILALGGNQDKIDEICHRSQVGRQLGELYLYQSDGIFRSTEEVDNHVNSDGIIIQPNAQPGDIRIKDLNDNGKIDEEDRTFSGDAWPDFQYGINASVTYMSFDLQMQLYGVEGVELLNVYNMVTDRFNDNSNYRKDIEPWTPENPDADFPRISYGDPVSGPAGQYSYNVMPELDRWKESGDYLRLKDLTIGYTLPRSLLNKLSIDNIRVYISGQNILTITKYSGLDPEVVSQNMWMRSWNDQIPNTKTVIGGIQMKF